MYEVQHLTSGLLAGLNEGFNPGEIYLSDIVRYEKQALKHLSQYSTVTLPLKTDENMD